ncbi:hypothetical protein CAS74_004750 [Pichia kudriavzevii]|uniref:Bacterial surface antigen (D15) domain-containing protein n=2 Tax=Pichia kudriavzevii TaxID=4909 RepID=A0A099P6Z3_PICKU|nr:uncharacterized protein C5L36_0A11000 [Pichia kudriavzevii]AWU74517.1 hypothetical protein C5L36_0A11000 [Pichia kudriavzevii]KGK40695.1 hypothetical protein JL09_g83 [Pichia kudriavzevii]OUT20017.1 hypothetical protein CAS74_004750 [Pichia kudriavzevii]
MTDQQQLSTMQNTEEEFQDSMFDTNTSSKSHQSVKEIEESKRQNLLDQYNMNAMNQVINSSESRPVNVIDLNVLGANGKFRESFINKQLQPIIYHMNDHGRNMTLSKLLKNIDQVHYNLMKSDVITNLGCQLSIPEQQPFNIFNPDLLNVIVNLQVVPVKKFFMKIGTNVGNGEGDGYVKLQWKNIFGGGESLDLDTNIASNELKMKSSKSEYLVNYSSPILNSANYKFNSILYHSSRNIDFTSYHAQTIEGLTLKVGTNYLPVENKINHELSFENLIRSIDIKRSTTPSYRNNTLPTDYFLFNAGSNFKSSLTYSLEKDTRDSKYIFEKGYYLRLANELSLLSNNKFIKTSFDYSKGYRISKDLLFNFNFKTGLINALSEDLIHPMDKFQLGGSNDMKGWLVSGMGPKQMNMSVGGNYFHAIGFNVFANIPHYTDSNFKLHWFTNVGKLTNYSKLDSNILKKNCVSTGVGLSYSHPMAAFELNWVVPISANSNDHLRKGLQWGIGISFL